MHTKIAILLLCVYFANANPVNPEPKKSPSKPDVQIVMVVDNDEARRMYYERYIMTRDEALRHSASTGGRVNVGDNSIEPVRRRRSPQHKPKNAEPQKPAQEPKEEESVNRFADQANLFAKALELSGGSATPISADASYTKRKRDSQYFEPQYPRIYPREDEYTHRRFNKFGKPVENKEEVEEAVEEQAPRQAKAYDGDAEEADQKSEDLAEVPEQAEEDEVAEEVAVDIRSGDEPSEDLTEADEEESEDSEGYSEEKMNEMRAKAKEDYTRKAIHRRFMLGGGVQRSKVFNPHRARTFHHG